MFLILNTLRISKPNSIVWMQYLEILNMLPENIREAIIKDTLRQLHNLRGMNTIGELKEIIPIGSSIEEFQRYITK